MSQLKCKFCLNILLNSHLLQCFFYSKNIKISAGARDLHISVKPEPSENVDTTRIKTPFGMIKPGDNKKKDVKKEPEIKKEPVQEKKQTTPKEESVKIVDPVKAEVPPSKISPETKASSSKASKKGVAKPVAQGKASISSFFNKSTAPKATKEPTNVKVEIKKEEPEKVVVVKKEEEVPRKRKSPTPEKPKTKPATKRLKFKDPPNKKRSRIQVIDDSSEDEQEEQEPPEEPESKFIKFDREFTPDDTEERSPVREEKSPVEEKKPEVAKNKAKRYVTKRFETDDGFVRTERVLEEYSASEDENDENKKKNSPMQEKKPSSSKKMENVSPQKKPAKSKQKDVGAKGKQGSIMSFFSKK